MAMNPHAPDIRELKPHITVFGVGGAGGNAVNNMIESGLEGVEFVVSNTDAQALASSKAQRVIQMGIQVTEGLGAGSQPEVGRAAAEEVIDEIRDQLAGSHMVFITAGMGGGTGTGAAPVVARAARELGILTVGVVTKPFQFEGVRRMRLAEAGINELQQAVDTLIVIPNQNLFRVATEKTTFADAFAMADQVLYSGVACITDLMVKEGLINLDFADVRSVMRGMGKAMMGTGEASGEKRALRAAEAAIANPLLDDVSMKGARGLLISITGGNDLTLYELDEAATRIREEVDQDANIILGATFDESLEGIIRVSVVATGIDHATMNNTADLTATEQRISEVAERLRAEARARATQSQPTASFRTTPAESVKAAPVLAQGTSALAAAPAPVTMAQPVEPAPQPVVRDDVVLTPAQPRPAVAYEPPAPQAPVYEEPVEQGAFIPPQAERAMRPARMPRIDELPLPAQREIRASRGEEPAQEHKPSLIQRLATIGFGRREEPQPAPAEPRQEAPRQPMSSVHAEYARRQAPPQAQRAPQSPMAPAPRAASEDEQLEIPAFLRRQAN
ncbi:cell division protein FtsZ [Microvirga arsenatis]|uniref:Cell division protein FtsZ n=1 Tax=Microvirga arsenatis TaxID=2692265 RepID=A0ABW9YUW0_9HYPH|nr:cell division protein FtsZ [Microvirga arsenatis]NBJ11917.1 cell division protein FtsZ [Microvirga arsenatis]NBJ24029.1 cell division protein FtsZ [Microvirga arsenatis]